MTWWIFQNVVVTAALALAAALVCRISIFRIGPVARHALWLLVLVKFVTPPLVVWPWTVPDPLGLSALNLQAVDRPTALPSHYLLVAESPVSSASELPALADSVDDGARINPDTVAPAVVVASVAWPWLLGTWGAGSLFLFGLEGVRLSRVARRIRAARPTEPAIVSRVAALSARMGLKPVPVVTIAGHASPAIWGFGRTRLLWPADLPADSSDACLDGLLVHELAHVKRRDHLVGWIELAAGTVWWWNPLFWFVRSARREQAELACDAWVISALPNGRRAYAESLLTLSGAAVRGEPSMALLGIRATSRRILERRLVMIMKGRAPLRLPWVGLVSLALVAAATLPAWATGSPQTPPPPPPVAVRPAPAPPPPPPASPAAPATSRATPQKVAPAPPQNVPPMTSPKMVPVIPSNMAPSAVLAHPAAPSPQGAPSPTWNYAFGRGLSALPADGQELIKGSETQREAIQKEADQKIAANQEALTKALQDLQDKYTKAGKLDEAVAIRDYLRAGGPGRSFRFAPNSQGGWIIRR